MKAFWTRYGKFLLILVYCGILGVSFALGKGSKYDNRSMMINAAVFGIVLIIFIYAFWKFSIISFWNFSGTTSLYKSVP